MGKTKRYNGDDDNRSDRRDWKDERRKGARRLTAPKVSKQIKDLQELGVVVPIKNF